MKANSASNVFSVLPSWTKANSFAWQIWLLSTQGKSTRSALLYSWITPAVVVKNGWQPLETEYSQSIVEDGRTVKVSLLKATFYGDAAYIREVVNKLLKGECLSEALAESDGTFPPNEFLNLNLGSLAEIEKSYRIRPEIFLAPEPLVLHWDYQATPSPTPSGCWVKQIFNVRKTDHLLFNLVNRKIDLPKLVKGVSMAFRQSSGFNLMESSAPRLGNIEWFHFAFADQYLSPFVSFFVKKEEGGIGKILTLKIGLDPLAKEVKKLLIRCRLRNVWEVIADEIVEREWGVDPISVAFKASEAISKVTISIWEVRKGSETANLIYEQDCTLLRELAMRQNIVATMIKTGKLSILDKLRHSEQQEKQKLMQYHRSVNSGEIRIKDFDNDQWTPAGQQIKSVMKELFPEVSKGRFFKNGWDESVMESGQLSFVKWLLETISTDDKCEVILIDPFLDGAAIELFSHARTINARYTLLTCTQHRESSDDDTGIVVDTEPKVAEAIRAHCKSHEVLLQGLNLEIFDLRSKDGGKKQLFHDRYILVVNSTGSVAQGFHLSNSIQGATRSAPLLITPIPVDILPEVKEYVEDLVTTEEDASPARGQTFAIRLFPRVPEASDNVPKAPAGTIVQNVPQQSQRIKEIDGTQELFAVLFEDVGIRGISVNDLFHLLRKRRIISEDYAQLQLFSLTVEELSRFVTTLEASEQKDFEHLWSLWGNLLAHSIYWNENGWNLTDEWVRLLAGRKTICSKLITVILGYQREEALITDRARLYGMFQGESFEGLLETSLFKFLYFPSNLFNITYPLAYACKFLVYSFPQDALRVLEKLVKNLQECQWDESYPEIRARMQLTNQLAYYFFGYRNRYNAEVQQLFLRSELVPLRAAAACALLFELRDQNLPRENSQFEKILDLLQTNLSDAEFRLSIAYLISCQNIPHKAEAGVLFQQLLLGWNGDLDLINRVTAVLSGRLWGNHSMSISNEFLIPLSNTGHVSSTYPFDYWNNFFKLKLISPTASRKDPGLSIIEQQRYDGFVINTDIELTECLIKLTGNLSPDIQCNAFKEWTNLTKPALQVVIQPFAQGSKRHLFDQSCTQLYWLEFILDSLMKKSVLHERALQVVQSYREAYAGELLLARTYIISRNQASVEKLVLGASSNIDTNK